MSGVRGEFNSKLGFILAAAGSAVGLGNIWKFPFEVGAGGGAVFVVVYLFFCFVLCFPVMVTEIAIGRKTNRNPVGAFRALGFGNWAFVGFLGVITGLLILSFYNVVAAWAFGYFIEMLLGNFGIGERFSDFTKDVLTVGIYALIFMGTTAFIVSRGVQKGIERAAKILMPSLVILILLLVLYALTLDNAMKGLAFYLVPDLSKLTVNVVYKALGQAFFSLSLGMGALITYGSYVSKRENIVSSAAYITLSDVGIAFIAGLLLFPLVFSQNLPTDGGPGLIFITLPGVFGTMPTGLGIVIGAMFFLLLSFAALTSTVSLLEVPVSYVVDEHQVARPKAVILVAALIFLIGIPSLLANGASDFFTNFITYYGAESARDFMTFVGDVTNDTFLPLGGFLITVFAAYVWKKHNLNKEIETGYESFKGTWVERFIDLAISYICPAMLGLLFIFGVLSKFFGIDIL